MEFILVNRASLHLDVMWLPTGLDDPSEGTPSGQLHANGVTSIGVGSEGHTFRLQSKPGNFSILKSQPFAYAKGKWNVLSVRQNEDGGLELEILRENDLKAMVARLHKKCHHDIAFDTCAGRNAAYVCSMCCIRRAIAIEAVTI